DTELPDRHISSAPHDAMVSRWRSRVASRPSSPSGSLSPTTFTLKIPTAPILPAPPTIDIPVGRLYHTRPGRPCRALITRKSGRPLPFHRLTSRYTSRHLEHFTSGSSSDHSSLDYSSLDLTTIADSSTPSRFIYPPHTRTSRGSEAYCRWRSAPLSTMYPPTASESSVRDSSSESSVGPSHKRCRSLAAIDSVEEDINADLLADIKDDVAAVKTVAAMDVEAGIDAGISIEVDVRVDREYEAEYSVRGTIEIEMVESSSW
ncbi:hypothetical protein Tco_0049623, partial [Tanacetum coccineum]